MSGQASFGSSILTLHPLLSSALVSLFDLPSRRLSISQALPLPAFSSKHPPTPHPPILLLPLQELAITSDEALVLDDVPEGGTIAIVGAGYIAVEFAGESEYSFPVPK